MTSHSRIVFQLPNVGSWFENFAVASNGNLLITRVDVPEIWSIDPVSGQGHKIFTLPAPLTSLTGITELEPGLFAVGAGQYDLAKGAIPGTWEVWTVNVSEGAKAPVRVAAIPSIGLLNGMTTWNGTHVLVADSTHGTIYSVDVAAGTYATVSDDELLAPGEGAFIPIGVNGIRLHPSDGHVYLTNSARMFFGRVPIGANAKATGPVEIVGQGFLTDDFTFGPEGTTAYITTHGQNTIVMVNIKEGKTAQEAVHVAGDAKTLELAGATACAFGRGETDTCVLYVVTAGALSMPVDGKVEPAKAVAVDLSNHLSSLRAS